MRRRPATPRLDAAERWLRLHGRPSAALPERPSEPPDPPALRAIVVSAAVLLLWYFAPGAFAVCALLLVGVLAVAALWAAVAIGCCVLGAVLGWVITGQWPGGGEP